MEAAVADDTPIVLAGDVPLGATLKTCGAGSASPVVTSTNLGIVNGISMSWEQYLGWV